MCPLFKEECLQKGCSWWDEKKNQCVIVSIRSALISVAIEMRRKREHHGGGEFNE